MHRLVSGIFQDVEVRFSSPGCRGTVERGTALLQRLDTLRVHMTPLDQTSTQHQNLLIVRQSHDPPIDN
jgi:hypothetical protein